MCIFLIIKAGRCNYDELYVHNENVSSLNQISEEVKPTSKKYKVQTDGVQLWYLVQKLKQDNKYRAMFLKHINGEINTIKFALVPSELNMLDYNWNEKVDRLVQERCELDHTLSWLSTLGGAFSALGDYYINMAETAAKISMHQLQLALRLGDPLIASRCKLYYSLSLIQRRQFRSAQRIIRSEYLKAVNNPIRDERLIRMCLGIWSKLQYERNVHTNDKLIKYYR